MPSLPIPSVDNDLLQGFTEWLHGRVTRETARDYISIINKKQWPPKRRSHIRAWRNYVKYLFSIGRISWEQWQHYNFFLKTPGNRKHGEKYIEDAVIINYIGKMMENGLTTIALLLLGGARLKHIVLMLSSYRPEEIVRHPTNEYEPRLACFDSFCRYYLGVEIGSKRCDYIYYPRLELEKQEIPYTRLRDMLNKRLGVNAKLFRKYANQVLERLAHTHNIRLDAVNLILSRELSVTGGHYLDTRNWADKLFPLYVRYIKEKILKAQTHA